MDSSSLVKPFAWRALFQTLFFSTLLFLVAAYFYWQLQPLGTPPDAVDYAALFAFLILYGLLTWLFQRNTLKNLVARQGETPTKGKAESVEPQEDPEDQLQRENHEKRLFMHLFSILQREGRLLDFLHEDLSAYEDDQIGAAVRSIHENCSRTVKRYLSPGPVMPQNEGETVEIPAGFDPHAVKLVGNVVGKPPFTGIVRHRGWQLRSIALPKLSEAGNPGIIAPAEVEIQ